MEIAPLILKLALNLLNNQFRFPGAIISEDGDPHTYEMRSNVSTGAGPNNLETIKSLTPPRNRTKIPRLFSQ